MAHRAFFFYGLPFYNNNKLFTSWDLDWFEREHKIGPLFPSSDDLGVPPVCGRLYGQWLTCCHWYALHLFLNVLELLL
uniref:Uncharacterized protein n=1 Tax=Utricularia reniformis TaxID=192314 RepID=A0A1Y0B2A4_9LAMI|nr:hypothetical protein AEK19_MT1389 [Utricularia reniformis]ART31585.1 hypothetical protein AEK19_MT1389 [Utricularia reniformis]